MVMLKFKYINDLLCEFWLAEYFLCYKKNFEKMETFLGVGYIYIIKG